jgi:hypothetical protein
VFDGNGGEPDEVIAGWVAEVKQAIAGLVAAGLEIRTGRSEADR